MDGWREWWREYFNTGRRPRSIIVDVAIAAVEGAANSMPVVGGAIGVVKVGIAVVDIVDPCSKGERLRKIFKWWLGDRTGKNAAIAGQNMIIGVMQSFVKRGAAASHRAPGRLIAIGGGIGGDMGHAPIGPGRPRPGDRHRAAAKEKKATRRPDPRPKVKRDRGVSFTPQKDPFASGLSKEEDRLINMATEEDSEAGE